MESSSASKLSCAHEASGKLRRNADSDSLGVLARSGHHHKMPQTGGLKQQILVFSQLQRPANPSRVHKPAFLGLQIRASPLGFYLNLITSLQGPLPKTAPLGIRASTHGFQRTQLSSLQWVWGPTCLQSPLGRTHAAGLWTTTQQQA